MKKKLGLAGLGIILAVILLFPRIEASLSKQKDEFYKRLDVFAEALTILENKYVEEKSPQDLIHGALRGVMSSLDSYSQFLSADEYRDLLSETEGKFGGLGIEITLRDNLLTVVSPIEDTPAWEAGVKAGDLIVKIDGEVTRNITLSSAVKKLRGTPGSKIVLTILRDGKILDFTLVRGVIKIQDVKRVGILEDGIGYIRITEFRENTHNELDKAIAKLKSEGLRGLIIDVRNNPGGLLESAIQVSSRFLNEGDIVVSTQSRDEKESVYYKALDCKEKLIDMPIVTLINRGSASGSEILAAALRDHKQTVLLGETSFGKGSVQTIIPLSDGSALRLTTSKYYTPKGVSIHEKGIDPDVKVETKAVDGEKEDEVFDKLERNDDFQYRDDYQVVRAIDLIKGLLVLSHKK